MITIPGRIPVLIYPFFWLLIVVIGWLNSETVLGTAIWSAVILISVLIHEYGHALTSLAFGQEAEINLIGLGGLTKRQGPKLSLGREFLIVFDGPAAGLLLFVISFLLLGVMQDKNTILAYALEVSINVNLFWTLLNLLPVFPLDGGHLMRIFLEGIFGVRGMKAAFIISILLAVCIGLFFFLIHQVVMGALFLMLAFESYRAWVDVKTMTPEDANTQLQEYFREALRELQAGNTQEALTRFLYIRQEASKGQLFVASTEEAAHILAEQGNYKQAYQWLYPLKNQLSTEYLLLLQHSAYRLQEWEETVKIGEMVYKQEPSIDVALMNAYSYGIMGKAVPAVGWLRCAVQLGVKDVQSIMHKREFDSIRNTDAFQKWLKSQGVAG